ncbi:hypothetical protein AB0M00_19685 [Streptomyces chartreusis]|uniref:hypothetical protein n=1 Tax=Streptomyces chartreusis TaxID=1969 RepID=UPI00343D635A
MSDQPIPLHRRPRPMTDEQRLVAVDAVIGYLNLPTFRPPIARDDAVHVLLRDGDELARWVYALGGDVAHTDPLGGAVLYTLNTRTPRRTDGSVVELRVHVALIAGEFAPLTFRGAESA